jgi:23S rRNA (guanosine2251-2'-O)-methyltransferase
MKQNKNTYIIYGRHAVEAAINNPKRNIEEIYCTQRDFDNIKRLANGVKIKTMEKEGFKKLLPNMPSQDIAVLVTPIKVYQIPDQASKLVILDKITDPQNLGSILRSGAAFGIDGVLYSKDGGAGESGSVAKAASGALEIVPLIEITNINNSIKDLKKDGFWIVGLDGSAEEYISSSSKLFEGKVAIIMGSEGRGLRELVRKNCDLLVKIPISKNMESLNVSNAAAIAMYEMGR